MADELMAYGGGHTSNAIIDNGGTLQQVKTQFLTAVKIQQPRNRNQVLKMCEEEVAIMGDDCFYSWPVKNKATGGKTTVEGPSVQAALMMLRNWGNCVLQTEVQETSDTYIVTATYVDMETGVNIQRPFRQRKKQNIGMKDNEGKNKDIGREEDIVFQIGVSKGTRNVILASLPQWLEKAVMAKAKENVIGKIRKKGFAASKEHMLKIFTQHGVTQDRIEAKIEVKATKWDEETLARLYGDMKALVNGEEDPEELFPPITQSIQPPQRKSDDMPAEAKIENPAETPPHQPVNEWTDAELAIENADSVEVVNALWERIELKLEGPDKVRLMQAKDKRLTALKGKKQ